MNDNTIHQFFDEIFEYNHHLNQKLYEYFQDYSDKVSEKSLKLFNHILNAHQIWNNRINPLEPTFGVWEIHNTTDLINIDKTNYDQTSLIIRNFDLTTIVSYSTSKGEKFSNSIKDILFHASNHSTYHRGQIASEFRQSGLDPLIADYIFYKR
jgi:uncharacterized damage-inducible protein DinB